MEDIAFFCVEVGLSLSASIFVLVYLGGLLKSILVDICGTEERADFWLGFSKLVFIFLPLLMVVYFSKGSCASTGLTSQLLRDMTSKVIFGELATLSIIGLVLWISASSSSDEREARKMTISKKEVL